MVFNCKCIVLYSNYNIIWFAVYLHIAFCIRDDFTYNTLRFIKPGDNKLWTLALDDSEDKVFNRIHPSNRVEKISGT